MYKKYFDESWDFRTADTKKYTHCFHSYPAMMIPQVADRLLERYGKSAKLMFDPYCGTGTSLVEANLRGINGKGTDINPLARLIAKAKTTPVDLRTLELNLTDFRNYILQKSFESHVEDIKVPSFKNIDYWFDKKIQRKLALIKRYIDKIEDKDISDFFKVAFSETVRECSWTRNSEFKLFRMKEEDLSNFDPDVFHIMLSKLSRNTKGLKEFIEAKRNDSCSFIFDFNTVKGIPSDIVDEGSIDIVVTSPPYGDSHATVAYGQFSRLSNQWLDFEDANQVDKRSMGGQTKNGHIKFNTDILDSVIEKISQKDERRAREIVSFYSDYKSSIVNISKVIKKDGYVCYVVGNRKVKGFKLPTDEITKIFFEENGFKHVETIIRNIPNKRMPSKNSPTNEPGKLDTTMNNEYIVVMQKV